MNRRLRVLRAPAPQIARRLALALAAVLLAPAALALDVVPTPTVSGPVTGGVRTGQPLNASLFDLSVNGYVEEEYFIDGTATDYGPAPQGPAAPYTTRMIVRRPADPARFNGTVVMEWYNVTLGYDFEADFPYLLQELLREGYAYVGVSAQIVGVTTARNWDPTRYATLLHPGDDYSWDIYSQAAQALRSSTGTDPMGGLPVSHILAAGASQSASRLDSYVDTVYPQIVPVIDGFLITVGGGPFRADLDVPVLQFDSESEADSQTQPDSQFFRHWEVAGASHADIFQQRYGAAWYERDWGVAPPFDDNANCTLGRAPKLLSERAALRALHRWVVDGVLPPSMPRYQYDGTEIARDAHGNTLGGIRLPELEVPVAAYDGEITSCGTLGGETTYFDEATLQALYPSQQAYDDAFRAAIDQAVAAGAILHEDRERCGDYVLGGDPAILPLDDCDADGVADMQDTCPWLVNPDQADDGRIGVDVADHIGNACQCGDVSGNGTVNGQDGNAIRRHGLELEPNPLFVDEGNCDVSGNGLCNGQDGNLVRRAALGIEDPISIAPRGQHCPNALGGL